MYISSKQRKKYLLIIAIIALSIPFTVFATYFAVQFFIGASPQEDPKGVVISNLTSNSITVTWVTDAQTLGTLVTTKGGKESKPYLDIRGNKKRYTHYVEINNLDPETEYTFYITSNGKKYTNENGKDFKFKTSKLISGTPVPQPVYGTINGVLTDDYLIYITTDSDKIYPASTTSSSAGNWVIDLSALRDGSSTLTNIENDTKMSVIVRGKGETGKYITGTYSELFSNEGKLNSTYTLDTNSTISITSILPSNAIIASVKTIESDIPKVTIEKKPEAPVVEKPEIVEIPPVEEQVNEKPVDIDNKVFRYVRQVSINPIAGTSSEIITAKDVLIGKESVIISNLTDTGFTISWTTNTPQEGYVKYGTSDQTLENVGYDEKDSMLSKGKYYQHSVSLSRLQPETDYFFEIISGTSTILDNNSPFSVKTLKTLSSPPEFKTISGKITGLNNMKDALITVEIEDKDGTGSGGKSTKASAIPDEQGNWIVSIGDIRTSDGLDYYNPSDKDNIVISSIGYFNNDSSVKTYSTIGDSDVELKVLQLVSIHEPVKVSKLKDYGVYNASVFNIDSEGIGGGSLDDLEEIPKTSIWIPSFVLTVVGIVFITIYLIRKRKSNIGMIDRVL